MPQTSDADDELAAEPWFSVGEHDVFPEEFTPFLVPPGPLREVFMAAHEELLDPAWWRGIQERLRAGEIFDTYPYRESRRLRR
jgi:isocitrate dehydrogenase kinase/phosphatase